MAKTSKEFEYRMQGMAAALDIVKKSGAEGLEKDIRYRRLTKAPAAVSRKEAEMFVSEISENLFVTVKTVSLVALKEEWGFGGRRLRRFEEKFDKLTKDACDMDWIGGHYVTLTDYAKWLQEENGIEIDTAVTERCQKSHDQSNPDYKRVELNRLVAELSGHGFADAARWLLERFAG